MTTVWDDYAEQSTSWPVSELLKRAILHVRTRGAALDLGAGALNDSMYLLERDFSTVIAVDKNTPKKDGIVARRIAALPKAKFAHVVSSFDDFHFDADTYDLVNAQNSLMFTRRETFGNVFARLLASLKPDGVFTGKLYGLNDAWNDGLAGRTFLSRADVVRLFNTCTMLHFKEIDGSDPRSPLSTKYRRHAYHIIARKN